MCFTSSWSLPRARLFIDSLNVYSTRIVRSCKLLSLVREYLSDGNRVMVTGILDLLNMIARAWLVVE